MLRNCNTSCLEYLELGALDYLPKRHLPKRQKGLQHREHVGFVG